VEKPPTDPGDWRSSGAAAFITHVHRLHDTCDRIQFVPAAFYIFPNAPRLWRRADMAAPLPHLQKTNSSCVDRPSGNPKNLLRIVDESGSYIIKTSSANEVLANIEILKARLSNTPRVV
jgi:hypothetical protein